ncbi:MAG: plasmid replication initiator TrfA [Planctomycetaceae bacterium]
MSSAILMTAVPKYSCCSDVYGLPRPIDDQVLLGMKALTYEAGFKFPKVEFTRYRLCKTIGWPTDGRTYRRLEEAFDRIAGTTLKFKDSWWDKGEAVWQSKLFHMIESVSLTSRDQIERNRMKKGSPTDQLCSFIWNETIWKSFTDGFIKKIDMEMFRRISSGRRHDVALRLYRILDKRFHKRMTAKFELRKLCIGTLGLSDQHRPSGRCSIS